MTPRVVCVCGGYGFPLGNASTSRIIAIGCAIRAAGGEFSVLHCGTSPNLMNREKTGVHQGIPFEYMTPVVTRPNGMPLRSLVYALGAVVLAFRLNSLRKENVCVYLYMQGALGLYVLFLCRMFAIPLVQEVCEWWPGDPDCSRFTHWYYRKRMFKWAAGALVISSEIQKRVSQLSSGTALRIHHTPVILDTDTMISSAECQHDSVCPELVWCGVVDSYRADIEFLIQAYQQVRQLGVRATLVIMGPCSAHAAQEIRRTTTQRGLRANADVVITGWIRESARNSRYCQAAALLLPLWDDDRSRTRMPNKLGEYLASGAPVITCPVGDVGRLLTDGETALLCRPRDVQAFAAKMACAVSDPERAKRIGRAGQDLCRRTLDLRNHAAGLVKFFNACITPSDQAMRRGQLYEN